MWGCLSISNAQQLQTFFLGRSPACEVADDEHCGPTFAEHPAQPFSRGAERAERTGQPRGARIRARAGRHREWHLGRGGPSGCRLQPDGGPALRHITSCPTSSSIKAFCAIHTDYDTAEDHWSRMSSHWKFGTGLTRARDSIGRATSTALSAAKVNAAPRIIRLIADQLEKADTPAKRIDMLYLVDSILQVREPISPGCK